MQSHTCTASGSLSFGCDSVCLEAAKSRTLSCLVHRRPFPALVSLGYQSRPLPVRCGSGTNQAEAGGHVIPEADEGGEWSPVHEA
ncbi:hypothetical protein QL285_060143 [Trifolium repens]|nr:hypothetical protein QL285_060143 [Trifolium repens]